MECYLVVKKNYGFVTGKEMDGTADHVNQNKPMCINTFSLSIHPLMDIYTLRSAFTNTLL